ncbi:uncharacterized protein MKK02DRAFT_37718 [Dioszegia hungarica]|uniref:Uncharacterized protein n=1 Tax=Dioszegia hungarica TaxID=4972 RepID=A0AA38LTM4_9TREE|nr:uncharacterized protein MKK02DRAFT_37718 [Dioszegia hungarica]KAI9634843.1 hypothetical protein MKK02DRAFT_37718 [Dioszegia hungarica]
METIKQIKKKLTVTQICVLGASSIFFILIILLFIFCLYANRQSRLETEEGGRMARGHWRDGEADIEVRRVSEPYARLATTGPAGPATRGDKQRMDRGPGGGAGPETGG